MRRRNGPADKLDAALDGRPVEVDGDLAPLIETYSLVCVLGWGLDRPVTTPTEMGAGMASVAELVHEDALRRLAGPIGYRQGVDLAVSGCVQLVSFGPVRVTARVEDLVLQHVELRSTGHGLSWSCTCPQGGSRTLCKHSVAVAVETRQRSPSRRR